MQVGDLVRAMGPIQGSKLRIGIIVDQYKDREPGFQCYEVMLEDGTISTYPSASLRKMEATNEGR